MKTLAIPVSERIGVVSGLLLRPDDARCLYVLAHGAGAGMRHAFMDAVAEALAEQSVATLRYQFPYMEEGRKRPDHATVAHRTVAAAVAFAKTEAPDLPLIAGGKSFGGRMTSQVTATGSLPDLQGLAFLGFPLHPPGKPGTERAAHLADVSRPMLFIQGTRDKLAEMDRITGVVDRLENATMKVVEGADHAFAVLKRSGRTPDEVLAEIAAAVAAWYGGLAAE